jgi:hypothetical protein
VPSCVDEDDADRDDEREVNDEDSFSPAAWRNQADGGDDRE